MPSRYWSSPQPTSCYLITYRKKEVNILEFDKVILHKVVLVGVRIQSTNIQSQCQLCGHHHLETQRHCWWDCKYANEFGNEFFAFYYGGQWWVHTLAWRNVIWLSLSKETFLYDSLTDNKALHCICLLFLCGKLPSRGIAEICGIFSSNQWCDTSRKLDVLRTLKIVVLLK